MSKPPINTVNLLIGARNTGKTVFVTGDEELQITGIIEDYIEKGMKVLIIDTYDHPSYRAIPIIQIHQINLSWKKGVYRCFVAKHEMEQLLNLVYKEFWNGVLIFEDAYKHQKGKLTQACASLIGDSKNRNVDIFFMYHTWKFVPKDLYIYLNYIEVFKTKTGPSDREEDELGDCFNEVENAYIQVKNNPNQYHHQSVYCEQ